MLMGLQQCTCTCACIVSVVYICSTHSVEYIIYKICDSSNLYLIFLHTYLIYNILYITFFAKRYRIKVTMLKLKALHPPGNILSVNNI